MNKTICFLLFLQFQDASTLITTEKNKMLLSRSKQILHHKKYKNAFSVSGSVHLSYHYHVSKNWQVLQRISGCR